MPRSKHRVGRKRSKPKRRNKPRRTRSLALVANKKTPARLHNTARVHRDGGGQTHAEIYSGALPHPDHLERFEAILPGTTDRFIRLAEQQSEHRQRMERKFLNFNGASQIIGVLFAGLAIVGGLAAGTFLLYHDKKTEGLMAMFGPGGAVAVIFVGVRWAQGAERKRKETAAGE